MQSFWKKTAEKIRLALLEKRWQKIAVSLAVIVVFCTTYMLILPALTAGETYCGYKEHLHSDSCYITQQTLSCPYGITEDTTDIEYAPEPISDNSGHVHTDGCYITERVFVCTADEHVHDDACYIAPSEDETDYSINLMADDIAPMAATTPTAQTVNFSALDGTGTTYYIVYTSINNNYYALDGNGNAVRINVNNDSSVTSNSMGNNLFWTFSLQSGTNYVIKNVGTSRYMHSYYNSSTDYGVTTSGNWTSSLERVSNASNTAFRVKSNDNYSCIVTSGNSVVFRTTKIATSNSASDTVAAQFYLAEVTMPQDVYHVWLDGTCGSIMSLYEAANTYQAVSASDPYLTLPTTWKSPSKYDYKLNGWYDIKNNKYYEPGDTVNITKNTVFYADWVAATYDVGQNNDHVVPSLDTNSFITTQMFDYSAIFNMQAVTHSGSVSATSHDETWSIVQNSTVGYNNAPSLGFIFRDWDAINKSISYGANRARLNDNQGTEITSQITDYVFNMSGGKNIIDLLFNPDTDVIGKTYVGEANYLYQFMENGSANYDGVHNGYYYYDATLNAASYNQTDKRFYIYDYLERTSDSLKDSIDANGNPTAAGAYSDFLPFNSPYVNNSNNKKITDYKDRYENYGNYQYDAKATNQGSAAENAGTNYWFGMKSEIHFYLPNDTGYVDGYGNYGNISTHGEHMNFQFSGDDDLWVFIDGKLVMDIGGLHGIMTGKIDFSTGYVTTDYAENNDLVETDNETELYLSEGDHTLTIYYMERGGSQSNCAIYFNIAPRYSIEIIKQDAFSVQTKLNGAEFSVYTDEACTQAAELWNSEAEYQSDMANPNDKKDTNVFTVTNGKAYMWGISPGKTYYIKETNAPKGYPETDDIVRVVMNNIGGMVCTTDTLRGTDNKHTAGFEIQQHDTDEGTRTLSIVLTNQKETTDETGSTNVRVAKHWADGSENIPESVQVYLVADSVVTGKIATLNASNEWTYTWTDLPKYNDDGSEIVYSVKEVQVSGFSSVVSDNQTFTDDGEWIKTDTLRDGDTFILVNKSEGKALSVSGNGFTWINQSDAQSNSSAQWTATADGMGFHLENGSGRRIVLNGTSSFVPSAEGNKVVYFYNSMLFAQTGNVYYYFASNASVSNSKGLEFELYKQSDSQLSGSLRVVTNTPIPDDKQTKISVAKSWSDGETAHINHSIVVHLYADGKDTGRTLTLNRNNGWSGIFEGLLYSLDDSDEPIEYTIVEDVFQGYIPSYSETEQIPGKDVTKWTETADLTEGAIYRFVVNGYALSSNSNNGVVSLADNPDNAYQQWKVVVYNGNYKLQNVGNGRYLYYNRSLTTNTGYTSSYANVSVSDDNMLRIGSSTNRYITLSATTVSTATNTSSAAKFTITTLKTIKLKPTYEITVNNVGISYVLPETGGNGIYLYAVAGFAVMLSAGMLLYLKKCNKLGKNTQKKHS